jgi:hypothetical protein
MYDAPADVHRTAATSATSAYSRSKIGLQRIMFLLSILARAKRGYG